MTAHKYKLLFFLLFSFHFLTHGQVVIFTAMEPPGPIGPRFLYQIDLSTCEFCLILPTPLPSFVKDVLVLPNGDVIVSGVGSSQIFSPPNPTAIGTIPGTWETSIVHPNGTIYVSSGSSLLTYDPVSNTTTFIGNFPSGLEIDAFFLEGNTLYGFGYAGPGTRPIYEINLSNPSQSVLYTPFSLAISGATTAGGQIITTWVGGGVTPKSDFNVFDLTTNSWTNICQTPMVSISDFAELPPGLPTPTCQCTSDAGTPTSSAATVCGQADFVPVFNNNQTLDPNDGVNYILYTNASDPLGSILFQNSTGVFPFIPPLSEGVTYYVARIVGNEVNGQVDLTDSCLDVSPPIAVIWRPLPQLVSMSVTSPDMCEGQCQEVTVISTGFPPFSLTWAIAQGGTNITPGYTVSGQNANTIVFEACVPNNATPGQMEVVICQISDAYCTNP